MVKKENIKQTNVAQFTMMVQRRIPKEKCNI